MSAHPSVILRTRSMKRGAWGTVAASLLIGASLAFAPGVRAATPESVAPPYGATVEEADCFPEGTPHCTASATADAATGAIDVDVALDVPDESGDVFGVATGKVSTDFVLDEAAAAVAVRATFHIDHAELGFAGSGTPAVSQSTLWGTADVTHDSCPGCTSRHASGYFEFALDEEYVEVDDETVVVETRLTHPDGTVPAGTLDLTGSLQADSYLWHDGAASTVARADATLTGFEVIVLGADPTRSETKSYLGPGGDVFYAYGTGPNCTTTGLEVGGVCFRLDPDDELFRFELADEHTGGPIGGRWQAYDDDDNLLGAANFCGTSDRLWIPEGATNVNVFTQTAQGTLRCEDATPATTGTVTATFWG